MKKTVITLTAVIFSFLVTSCGKWEEAVEAFEEAIEAWEEGDEADRQANQIEGTDLYRSLSRPASIDIPSNMGVSNIFDTARELLYKHNGVVIVYHDDGFKVERIMNDIYKFTMNVRKYDKGIAKANRSRVDRDSWEEHPGPYTLTFDAQLKTGGLFWEVSNIQEPGMALLKALLK